jgi:peptidoglycan/LPS O-acetylase OafA/YrhL
MGMLLAVLSVAAAERDVPHRLVELVTRRPWIPWAIALALWILCSLVTEDGSRTSGLITDPQYLVKHELYAGVVFFILVPAVFGDRSGIGWVRRLLAWRPLLYVGTISYSFYLWHYAVIAQQARWWGRGPENWIEWLLWYAGALAGSIVIGSLGYFLIEKPMMRFKRFVPSGPRGTQLEAAQAKAAP